MKRIHIGAILLGAVLVFAMIGLAKSQSPQSGDQSTVPGQQVPGQQGQQNRNGDVAQSPAAELADQLTGMLNLSDSQAAKVKSVLEEERGKMMALRDDPTLSLEDKEAKLLVIRQNASQQIMSVLSPEQQQKLLEVLQQQDQDQGNQDPRAPQPPSSPPPK